MKILFFLLIPVFSFGQNVYDGFIVDKILKKGISYATIGLVKENTGTNADENGNFKLKTSRFESDSLYITSVGYKPLKVAVDNLPLNMVFEMDKKETNLLEVIIKNYTESTTLNSFSNCSTNTFTTSKNSGTQYCQLFETTIKNSFLQEITICKFEGSSKFRIRIYDYDTITKKPSIDLVDSVIEIEANKRNVKVNLEKYHILIPNKKFFIAIEWLHITFNESNYKTKINGQKMTISQYAPFISYRKQKLNSADENFNPKVLYLNFQGKWIPPYIQNINLMISAKIKF